MEGTVGGWRADTYTLGGRKEGQEVREASLVFDTSHTSSPTRKRIARAIYSPARVLPLGGSMTWDTRTHTGTGGGSKAGCLPMKNH